MAKLNPVCAAAFDFRCHGKSDDKLPTMGIAEVSDVTAVVDCLVSYGFPAPFILVGVSMGAMVAAHSARMDPRVSAAICVMPPASPLDALNNIPNQSLRGFLREAVTKTYGKDLLLDGDLTWHELNPSHQPRLLYLMGDQDPYGIERSKRVWEHWYKESKAEFDVLPSEAPDQRKWFKVAEGFGHDLSRWPLLRPAIGNFFDFLGIPAECEYVANRSRFNEAGVFETVSLDSTLSNFSDNGIDVTSNSLNTAQTSFVVLQALSFLASGAQTKGKEALDCVWRNREALLKLGKKGIQIVSLVSSIMALPARADAMGHVLISLLGED